MSRSRNTQRRPPQRSTARRTKEDIKRAEAAKKKRTHRHEFRGEVTVERMKRYDQNDVDKRTIKCLHCPKLQVLYEFPGYDRDPSGRIHQKKQYWVTR